MPIVEGRRDEFEAMISANDVNFLAVHNKPQRSAANQNDLRGGISGNNNGAIKRGSIQGTSGRKSRAGGGMGHDGSPNLQFH